MNAPRLGDYEIHRAWEGFSSIRQVSSGEIMHSRTAPMEEARQLYVGQAHLAERLRGRKEAEPVVLWDVGLGAAANAMAALRCYEEIASRQSTRPFQIISFENDLDSLRLAVANPDDFPYVAHAAPAALLARGEWQSDAFPGLSWVLIHGDFLKTMSDAAAAPDLIFYDMFSTRTSSELWSWGTFRRLFEQCRGRAVELFTYTCSTANRAALLAAGFHVARGRNAGAKVETTIALTPAAAGSATATRRHMLSRSWLEKWDRSAAKFPGDVAPADRPAFEKLIREHKQFRKSAGPERLPAMTRNSG
ncbi:MAG TPA: MnmC family methyltransferase [Chthoniobacterales bacterium]|nr:MnmC family methyltransferase [Chthoniobacterales bacterium]